MTALLVYELFIFNLFQNLHDLKKNFYDLNKNRKAEQFVKTTKAILLYVSGKYDKNTTDFMEGIKNLDILPPVKPADPHPNDPFWVQKKWEVK